MSICDNCIHDYVCGLEDNHEEGIVNCADKISKDIFNKIRTEIIDSANRCLNNTRASGLYIAVSIIDEYIRKEKINEANN